MKVGGLFFVLDVQVPFTSSLILFKGGLSFDESEGVKVYYDHLILTSALVGLETY